MYIEQFQKYNRMVFEVEEDSSLKDVLYEKMNLSVRFVTKAKKDKLILVNGIFRKLDYMLKTGDMVSVDLVEDQSNFLAQDLGLEIIYEDFDLFVVDKPAYMVVHPTKSHVQGTVANFAKYHLDQNNELTKPRFVNRLDMNTSGLVIVAKNAFAHAALSKQMKENLVIKEYLALALGQFEKEKGTIDKAIYRPSEDSICRVIDDRGQRSITHYEVIESNLEASLVKLRLETGRTHQIRVHLASIGHPIFADELYGQAIVGKRQLLHAFALSFKQPRTGKTIDLKSPLPEDFLNELKNFNLNKYL